MSKKDVHKKSVSAGKDPEHTKRRLSQAAAARKIVLKKFKGTRAEQEAKAKQEWG